MGLLDTSNTTRNGNFSTFSRKAIPSGWSCLPSPPQFSSVQFSHSVVSNSLQPHGTPGFPVHHQLLEFTQTHVHRAGDTIEASHPMSSPSPPHSMFSSIRVFSSESVLLIRWPKYCSFSISISPSNEYSGPISFRIDCFALHHLLEYP